MRLPSLMGSIKTPKFHAGIRKQFRLAKAPTLKAPNFAAITLKRIGRDAMPGVRASFHKV